MRNAADDLQTASDRARGRLRPSSPGRVTAPQLADAKHALGQRGAEEELGAPQPHEVAGPQRLRQEARDRTSDHPADETAGTDESEDPLRLARVEEVAGQDVELAHEDEREDVEPDVERPRAPRRRLHEQQAEYHYGSHREDHRADRLPAAVERRDPPCVDERGHYADDGAGDVGPGQVLRAGGRQEERVPGGLEQVLRGREEEEISEQRGDERPFGWADVDRSSQPSEKAAFARVGRGQSRSSGRRPANPPSGECQNPIRSSPYRQQR